MENLFQDFNTASREEWLQQLKKDLKKDDVDALLHPLIDGIVTQAYLRNDDRIKEHSIVKKTEEKRKLIFHPNDWEICFSINANDALHANKEALHFLQHGADAIRFTGDQLSNQEELRLLLRNILPDVVSLHFSNGEASIAIALMLDQEFSDKEKDAISGSVSFDFLSEYAFIGHLLYGPKDSFSALRHMSDTLKKNLPGYHSIAIDVTKFHNAGAKAAQEIALALSIGASYGAYYAEQGLWSDFAQKSFVNMALDSSYFMNIAKLRAMRLLWQKMCKAFDNNHDATLRLHTESSQRNKSSHDIHNNLLRLTLESMAAAVGGSDLHICHRHDEGFVPYNRDAMRYALNIQHLLKHESHLDKVLDPAFGAWYIENLTEELMKETWKYFLELEDAGGYLKAVESAKVFEMVHSAAEKRRQDFNTLKSVTVGLNKYTGAKTFEPTQSAPAMTDYNPEADFPLLEPMRVIADFEKLRAEVESKKRQAILVSFGDPKMSKARLEFCSGLLHTAGILFTEAPYAERPDLSKLSKEKADLFIFCAADQDYAVLSDTSHPAIVKEKGFIAGKFTDDALRKSLKGNLFAGMDVVEWMKGLV
ncbi:MAG: methylmalonyl-CoA mutase family protein [Flavobacteriales bacterium]